MAICKKMVNSAQRIKLTFSALALLVTSPAQADFYLHHWENRQEGAKSWKLGSDLRYFTTSSNYDSTGTAVAPTSLDQYSRIVLDIGAQYGITDRITLFGRTTWSYVNLKTTSISANSFGFGDQTLGGNARLIQTPGGITVDAQVQLDFGVYNNVNASFDGTPFLGDGSLDITTGGFVDLPIHSESGYAGFHLTGGVGYTFRSNGFSSAVPWSVVGSYRPRSEGVFFTLGFLGLQSLKNDNRSLLLPTASGAGQGTGGSFMSDAVNPTLVTIRGQLGYQGTSELALMVSAEQTIYGFSSPRGFTIGGGITLRPQSQTSAPTAENARPQSANRTTDLPRTFQSYSLEARVTRMNDRLGAVRIDKGHDAGVSRGDTFDVMKPKADGTAGETVARGRVTAVSENAADIRITEYFKEVWIEEGFHAKRVVQ
jgi:hypothetical protein